MKSITKLMLAAATFTAFSHVSAAEIKAVDSIAAVADNDVITQRQLNAAVARAAAEKPQGMSEADFRRQVLTQMINQSLVAQAGKRRNIQATDAEIDQVITQTAAARKMTADQFYAASGKNGLSREAVRSSVADSIITQKVQQQVSMENARVSDQEIDAFIAQAQANGQALPEGSPVLQYRAQHILIREEPSNPRGTQSEVRKIWEQARSGQSFDQLARQHSIDSGSAANGGDLGWFSDGQMVPDFEKAVHELKPGQVSAPVRSQFGWHIIKLNEVRETGSQQDRVRNAVRRQLAEQKAGKAVTDLLQQLHQGAYIDIR